jgi:pimeloyl-ACP methyl ester carboxylesterase
MNKEGAQEEHAEGPQSDTAGNTVSGAFPLEKAPDVAGETTVPSSPPTPYEVGFFESEGVQLYYEIHGHGPRVLVFMHGILMDSNMNRRLANDLAATGHRVILLDLPGHGLSDKPKRASFHRMDTYAHHVVSLLDHLGIDQAVIGGVSLGANVSLLVAAQDPERVKGMVIEMPVLEWAVPAAAITFVPMLLAVHFARPLVSRTSAVFRRLPRTGIGPVDSAMNTLSNDPQETAAVLHGILAGPIAPTVDQRAAMDVPTLVIGHRVDRIHPFHDAEQLVRRLPNGRLVQATSVLELRMHPERLTGEIGQFLDDVWDPPYRADRKVG